MKTWIDMHCDTLSELLLADSKETLQKNLLCVDVQRMEQTEMLAEFFACFAEVSDGNWEAGYEKAKKLITRMEEELKNNRNLKLLKTGGDVDRAEKSGEKLALLTIEEGGILNGKLERLDTFYQKGIRLITLTWNYENCIGFPNSLNPRRMQKGLKPFGKQVIEKMNTKGMLVDVSHLSDGGFWDCIRWSKKPIVASHSNARALCPHPRNLSDEMLHAIGDKGGVAGLNFYPRFLRKDSPAQVSDLARHAMHMLQKAGEDAVALGTDFDGFAADQKWFHGIEDIESVWEMMKRAGFTERQLDKIALGNIKRVLHEVL